MSKNLCSQNNFKEELYKKLNIRALVKIDSTRSRSSCRMFNETYQLANLLTFFYFHLTDQCATTKLRVLEKWMFEFLSLISCYITYFKNVLNRDRLFQKWFFFNTHFFSILSFIKWFSLIISCFSDYPLRPDEENEIKVKYENMLGSQADIQVCRIITF